MSRKPKSMPPNARERLSKSFWALSWLLR